MGVAGAQEPSIGELGAIGDCGTLALVDAEANLRWLCLPRFDSPSIFGSLLDPERGGHWWIRPDQPYTSRRHYIDRTNVLVTEFETETGGLRITDLMPVGDYEIYRTQLRSDHQVLRKVECTWGTVDVRVDCVPRPEYGSRPAGFDDRGSHGFFCRDGPMVLVVRSELPLRAYEDGGVLRGRERLRSGQTRWLTLAQDEGEPAVLPILGDCAQTRLDQTVQYWQDFADACAYAGPYAQWVVRSALTLKLLTFSASGAIVAAGTTSLPEQPGGHKNWDYRYSWIRDSAFTLRALLELGFLSEGEAFFSWLLHSTRRSLPLLHVLYDVLGTRRTQERELPHLRGFACSQPVRIGNDARDQFQLDMYGTLIADAVEYCSLGGELGRWQQRMFRKIGDAICERWCEPDDGIWEERGPRRHHTLSVAMCAVGLERLVDLHDAGHLHKCPVQKYRRVATKIRQTVEERGYDESVQSYVDEFDTTRPDASLLLLPIYGYLEATHPRMQSTFRFLQRHLSVGSQWYRSARSLGPEGPNEGTFGICGFWAVEVLARMGRVDEAHRHFQAMLETANDLGLFSEEYDRSSGQLLGNFPQAFTHVGLINAALTLAKPVGRRESLASPRPHRATHHDRRIERHEVEEQEVGT